MGEENGGGSRPCPAMRTLYYQGDGYAAPGAAVRPDFTTGTQRSRFRFLFSLRCWWICAPGCLVLVGWNHAAQTAADGIITAGAASIAGRKRHRCSAAEPVNLSTWQLHQVEHRPPCPAIQDGSSYTRKKAGRRSLDNRRGCRICLPWCSRPDGRTADTTPGLFRYRRKYTRNGRNATGSSAPGTAAADNQPGPVAGFLDPMKYQGDHHRSSHRQTIPDCIAGSFHIAPVLLTRQATTGPG